MEIGSAGAQCASVRQCSTIPVLAAQAAQASGMETDLSTAGAGAYYFAKREINADRQAKLEQSRRSKQAIRNMEYAGVESGSAAGTTYGSTNGSPARTDNVGSPSQEASNDPAATRHAPATESQRITEKSKFESSTTYRSPKGDRFS